MALEGLLWCIAILLGTSAAAAAVARNRAATPLVYGAALAVTTIALVIAVSSLLSRGLLAVASTLPVGLPWMGAHFRLDALAAFFLLVVNLGGATASLYGLGYGKHEEAPPRVLPFFFA